MIYAAWGIGAVTVISVSAWLARMTGARFTALVYGTVALGFALIYGLGSLYYFLFLH